MYLLISMFQTLSRNFPGILMLFLMNISPFSSFHERRDSIFSHVTVLVKFQDVSTRKLFTPGTQVLSWASVLYSNETLCHPKMRMEPNQWCLTTLLYAFRYCLDVEARESSMGIVYIHGKQNWDGSVSSLGSYSVSLGSQYIERSSLTPRFTSEMTMSNRNAC